jgi:Proprotein convertase P-domain
MGTKTFFILVVSLVCAGGVQADTITLGQTDNNSQVISPNDFNGLAETINLGSSIQSITDVELSLNIGGSAGNQPFNGNYYAYLQHGPTLVVLLNRVGVTAGNPFGYADEGFDVTFSGSGSDIHNYQNGPYNLNTDGQLTGTWAPDGRTANPTSVLDSSARGDLLDAFDGENSGGDWTLFVVDADSGDLGNLNDWSLQVTGTSADDLVGVPDNGSGLGLLMMGLGALGIWSLMIDRQGDRSEISV